MGISHRSFRRNVKNLRREILSLKNVSNYLIENEIIYKKMGIKTMIVPKEIDRQIAVDALKAMNVKIDTLTKEQRKYAESW